MKYDFERPFVSSDGVFNFVKGLSSDPITKFHKEKSIFYELNTLRYIHALLGKLSFDDGSSYIVDGGANIGNHTLYWAGRNLGLDVVSFEMNPLTYGLLSENVLDSGLTNISTHNIGLSDAPGVCGIINNKDNPLGGAQIDKSLTSGVVSLTSLDYFFITNSFHEAKKCKFIKLDIEGHEYQALMGGVQLISRDRPLIFLEIKEIEDFKSISKLLEGLEYFPVYADSGALPNFLYCPFEMVRVFYSDDELLRNVSSLCFRVVESWQLRRSIKKLENSIKKLSDNN